VAFNKNIDSQIVLDSMSQAVLIFDSANRLVMENAAARATLGGDLKLIRAEGWVAAALLFNARLTDPKQMIEAARTRAVEQGKPVRFHVYRSGERIPCWIAALHAPNDTYVMITIEMPDWSAVSDLMDKYLEEVREVVNATRGHAELITQSVERAKPDDKPGVMGKRVTGFTKVIDMHMYRLHKLTDLVERLERVRTGRGREEIRRGIRRVKLGDFIEDFMETLDDDGLVDPENDSGDHRKRIQPTVQERAVLAAAPDALAIVLRDMLRNAIMYSMRGSPIKLNAYATRDNCVQIDVVDEGYGIRAAERERVFVPFTRSRQPQIMGEFGYGLSLYLCKNEVEAMNGRMWFESEEGAGSTFSVKLPAWRDTTLLSSSSEG
jgi:signal transduction histidine kinase